MDWALGKHTGYFCLLEKATSLVTMRIQFFKKYKTS